MHILILGARAPACLEWARAFSVAGWKVTVADSLYFPVARFSRASDDFLHLPEPRSNPDRWISDIRNAVIAKAIDVILPTCEEVFYLGNQLGQLPCRVICMELSSLHKHHHKYLFTQQLQDWPCQAPESHLLLSQKDVVRFTEDSRRWVFKPAYSRFASRTLICPEKQHIEKIPVSKDQPWVAQRFVDGKELCSYSIFANGRLTAHACYHPKYRVGRGSGIWFEPVDCSAIRTFVERFGAATGFNGQVAFDFIEAEDGQCYVLECNPRATSGVHLFHDQPLELVQALIGEPTQPVTPTAKASMVGLAMLIIASPVNFWRYWFWQDLLIAKDVIVRKKDWGPLFGQIPALFEIITRAVRKRRGLLAAATADIEWDGQPMRPAKKC